MTRTSDNQYGPSGALLNGFDYDVQVWVKDGIVQPCGHPADHGPNCCNARRYAGKRLTEAFALEADRHAATPPPRTIAESLSEWERCDAAIRAKNEAFETWLKENPLASDAYTRLLLERAFTGGWLARGRQS